MFKLSIRYPLQGSIGEAFVILHTHLVARERDADTEINPVLGFPLTGSFYSVESGEARTQTLVNFNRRMNRGILQDKYAPTLEKSMESSHIDFRL